MKEVPPDLQAIDVVEHPGETIPLNLTFTNSRGDSVQLGEYFHQGKPVILALYYTNCPMLCSLVLNGLATGVSELSWTPGKEFQMLSVSFDPRDNAASATAVRERYLGMLRSDTPNAGWEFLVGPESQSRVLAEALGFKYYYIPEKQQYAHPAVVFVLTEDGKISRYLYGIEYKERDLRLALLEASEGKIGTTIDRIILYCYHYDPDARGYVALAGNIMKLGGIGTLILLGLFLGIFWGRERIKREGRGSREARQ